MSLGRIIKITILIFLVIEIILQITSYAEYAVKLRSWKDYTSADPPDWITADNRYNWWRHESQHLSASYKPYLGWRTDDVALPHINVTGGLRKTVGNADPQDPDVKKLYVFGGSSIWGFYAKDNETVPSYLAQKLNSDGQWSVINYGELGYTNTQELVLLLLLLQGKNIPDYAVFLDGCNDLRTNTPYGKDVQLAIEKQMSDNLGDIHAYRRSKPPENRSIVSSNAVRAAADFIAEYYKTLQYPLRLYRRSAESEVKPEITRLHTIDPDIASDIAGKLSDMFTQNMRLLESLSEEYGFQYYVMLQPLITDKVHRSAEENSLVDKYELQKESGPVWNLTKDRLVRQNLPNFFDMTDVFSDDPQTMFADRCHITPAGNQKIADRIAELIK